MVMKNTVNEDVEIEVPVDVPFINTRQSTRPRTIIEEVEEEYQVPVYVKKESKQKVPVYTKIKIITPTPYKCQECTTECV